MVNATTCVYITLNWIVCVTNTVLVTYGTFDVILMVSIDTFSLYWAHDSWSTLIHTATNYSLSLQYE